MACPSVLRPPLGLAALFLALVACAAPSPTSPPTTALSVTELSASPSPASADAPTDLPRYDIELAVDVERARVSGHQEVQFTNSEQVALDDLFLRLFPNTPGYGGAMTVTNTLLDGRPVTPVVELEGSALRLPLAPPLQPGRLLQLSLDFVATVPTTSAHGYAQFSYLGGVMALPNVYPLVPVYDDEGWNVEIAPQYGDAVYSDLASYTVHVTAPEELTLVASGSCDEGQPGRWDCRATHMRDFALVLSEDYSSLCREVGGVALNSYFYAGHEEGGELALAVAAEALAVFEALFGEYPYAELDVAETPTRAGGIEYPGLVVIGDSLYLAPASMEWVVVHEVAHQWWYAVVGNDQVDEPWLDEALTQYSTLLYYENRYGVEVAADIAAQQFEGTHERLVESGQDMPAGLPVAAYDRALYGPVVYNKGPLYFRALREAVGDKAFFDILRSYYCRHRFGIATPESFLTAVKIVTGDAHRALYERWIEGAAGE